MPWKERSVLPEREDIVARYRNGEPVARLARDDAVSRKTIRKLIGRATSGADDVLGDRSRRPHASPRRTPAVVRVQVLALAEALRPGAAASCITPCASRGRRRCRPRARST